MDGKIALEEHFNLAEFTEALPQYVSPQAMKQIEPRLLDVAAMRLEEMDAAGIELSLLSLTAPGIQAETDPQQAVARAQMANDTLAKIVGEHPGRFRGLAVLPMQAPEAAVAELQRCAVDLRFPAVMLNGFTNIGDAETGWYYDHQRFLPVWERAEALGVPVYLHPRDPLPGNQGSYEGHPELYGAVWTFTVETATHALRLMTSGLFDRHPDLNVILGHLGETLPFSIWRIDHRISFMGDLRKFSQPLTHYLQHNFYVTTSGNFRTQALAATLSELGADRVLSATDYPYESMREAAAWFDTASISEADRLKIGRTNAQQLFRLAG